MEDKKKSEGFKNLDHYVINSFAKDCATHFLREKFGSNDILEVKNILKEQLSGMFLSFCVHLPWKSNDLRLKRLNDMFNNPTINELYTLCGMLEGDEEGYKITDNFYRTILSEADTVFPNHSRIE